MTPRTIIPLLIAAPVFLVAQLHGAPFWVRALGDARLGWAVSLVWEGASIWLWWMEYPGKGYRLTKWAVTIALGAGLAVQSALAVLSDERLTALPDWGRWAVAALAALALPAFYALGLVAISAAGWEYRRSTPRTTAQSPAGPRAESWHQPLNAPRTPAQSNNGDLPADRAALVEAAKHRRGGISQRALADSIGVAESTLRDWLNGRTSPERGREIAGKLEGKS